MVNEQHAVNKALLRMKTLVLRGKKISANSKWNWFPQTHWPQYKPCRAQAARTSQRNL